ncbi:MAG: GNAT family N-acetyltransferase, partial [Saprospiraceae bacterium]
MKKNITYKTGIIPSTEAIINLYDDSGINRPTTDKPRIKKMYEHANLVITAWDNEELVGVS